jgi:hypothetical protein
MSGYKLTHQFATYAEWRNRLMSHITDYSNWLDEYDLNDVQTSLRISQLMGRLHEDKLNVAFVAEFSRGKSELINAIFFSDYGQRLLPSSAGRTTMCPTELFYDASKPVSLMLLPIETRLGDVSVTEYKLYKDAWQVVEFDVNSNDSMVKAFKEVERTKRVSVDEATKLGLYNPNNSDDALHLNKDGSIDIPSWRYAMINFPHALLEQGLVILDTPGLNAIGTEPELTLNMLPNAHAVLFILGADTGVTKSELDVWRKYISDTRWKQKGRFAVLNKIDGLWDELKDEAEILKEIDKQVHMCAGLLDLDKSKIFPTSAQKGLFAKINDDQALLERSRLLNLERALSEELIPSKKEIIKENTQFELSDLIASTGLILDSRMQSIQEQLEELRGLRGKNEDVIEHMMNTVKVDKESFEKGLQRFTALRSVFSKQTHKLFMSLGMDNVRDTVQNTRETMLKAKFTKTIRNAMDDFFLELKQRLASSDVQVQEIKHMMDVMYAQFAQEHGLRKLVPPTFSTLRYQKEIEKYEKAYKEQFNTSFNMITHEQLSLTNKFFETLASRVVYAYEIANRDVENWLKAVIAPMESQVREHQIQLRRRLESIKRIYQATDTLEDRISELEEVKLSVVAQAMGLKAIAESISHILEAEDVRSYMQAA